MSDPQLVLNRTQLAEFLKDPRAIRAFEKMFTLVSSTLPDNIETAQHTGESLQGQIAEVVGSIAALTAAILTQPPHPEVGLTNNVLYTEPPCINIQSEGYFPPIALGGAAEQVYTYNSWAPIIGATTGTITSTTVTTATYTRIGDIVHVNFEFTVTNNGTGSGAISITLPFVAKTTNIGYFRETAFNGRLGSMTVGAGTNVALMVFYDNSYPAATSHVFVGNITYRI